MVQLNPFTIRYSWHDTGLNVCVSRNSYFKASLPNVMVFEGWNLGLDEVIGVEPPWLDQCPYKGMKGFVFTQPCEGTRKRVLTRTSLFWHPDHGFSNFQNCRNIFLSPGDLPHPGIEPGSPALHADSLPSEPPGKTKDCWGYWKCEIW